ncbi:30S ribosomal protein S6 [Cardinium endosymbiont of Oedothorax gibbosus]|uniref:30S ribosomal protein S6 n=1 Tax=Cardinium endosymbiont of Oedothorax gibbosus TaxID=931101 RepID=UPI00202457D7|nr:30S ribosomal protein S6 [Cardinium endosymbiont of Oedothorax gibbosus]CAH2560194.1 30S ribosomal protein S6 [Cardinium endosymbiont of Oedothorax gibbosus]
MRHYETVFILSPVLSNNQIKASISRYRSFLVGRNATIVHEEEMGLKPLAYPIKHKKSGVYHLIEFASDPSLIKELEITYARDEQVLRFLTFALDKHALAHNMARRSDAGKEEPKKAVAL